MGRWGTWRGWRGCWGRAEGVSEVAAAELPTPRRSVALVGKDGDVEALAKHFGDMEVGWIRGNAQTGWTLSSSTLEPVSERRDVLRLARVTIEYQDKVMYVNHPGYAGVAVGDTVYVARTGGVEAAISSEVAISSNITFHFGNWQLRPEPLCPHAVARAAHENTNVKEVLQWLDGLEGDWIALYNVAEVMGKVLPGQPKRLDSLREFAKRGWISQDEASWFKRLANQARHPARAPSDGSTSLSKGQSLMRRVARRLLLDTLEAHSKPQ